MNDPDWKPQAACRRHPHAWWYPPDPARGNERRAWVTRAQIICRTCPAIQACAQAALDGHEHHGVWAGVDIHGTGITRAVRQLELIAATGQPPRIAPKAAELPLIPRPCIRNCGRTVVVKSFLPDHPEAVEHHAHGMCKPCYHAWWAKHVAPHRSVSPLRRTEVAARRNLILELTRQGWTIERIADYLNVHTRTVERGRQKAQRHQDAS